MQEFRSYPRHTESESAFQHSSQVFSLFSITHSQASFVRTVLTKCLSSHFPYFSLLSHTSTSGRGRRIHILDFFFFLFSVMLKAMSTTPLSLLSLVQQSSMPVFPINAQRVQTHHYSSCPTTFLSPRFPGSRSLERQD